MLKIEIKNLLPNVLSHISTMWGSNGTTVKILLKLSPAIIGNSTIIFRPYNSLIEWLIQCVSVQSSFWFLNLLEWQRKKEMHTSLMRLRLYSFFTSSFSLSSTCCRSNDRWFQCSSVITGSGFGFPNTQTIPRPPAAKSATGCSWKKLTTRENPIALQTIKKNCYIQKKKLHYSHYKKLCSDQRNDSFLSQ